jgi:hypothetical protein
MPIIALGAAMNVLVISLNDGVMPAASAALRIAGIDQDGGFANSAALAHPKLLFLGDVIPVPGPWPIGNVLSVGDLLIFTGALVLLHVTCGSRFGRAFRRRAKSARPAQGRAREGSLRGFEPRRYGRAY